MICISYYYSFLCKLQTRNQFKHTRFIETRERLLSAGITELSQLSLPQRQEFARQSIKRIELGRGGVIDIEWTFGGTSHYPDSAGG